VSDLHSICGHFIFALWFLLSIFYLSLLACSQPLQIGCLSYFHTWCGLSANLGGRSETCCMRLAENTGRKNRQKFAIFATKARIDKWSEKKLVKQQCLSHMSSQYCELRPILAAEICWRVWGTPVNFNRFHILAALLRGTLVVGISQTLRAPPIFDRTAITLGIGPHF